MNQPFKFYEFFCGGGMARAGLGQNWECVFANDIDVKKAESYKVNWGDDEIKVDDISNITTEYLSDQADLAWASFSCRTYHWLSLGRVLIMEKPKFIGLFVE
jgi:DNA (cytosine-5)-methyltransferase 1